MTDIHQVWTHGPHALGVLLSEAGLHLTLGVGQLVVLVTLDGSLDGVADAIGQSEGVVCLLLALSHLNSKLVLSDGTRLVRHLGHSQVDEVVISFSFLGIVSQRSEVSL